MSVRTGLIRGIPALTLILLATACQSDSSDVVAPPAEPPQGQPPGPPLTSGTVSVNKSAMLLTAVGQSRVLTAQTANASGSPVNAAVTWTSSSPNQVSVDETGRVTARAIGSAQIFATSGSVRSAPVFVVVAEPQPGALLVTDAQVVSVQPPILAPGEVPGPGTRYEVRLTGISTPPSPGTVVLAAENSTVAGKVVSTRMETGVLVVTLAVTPLYDLFTRYDINWTIDITDRPTAATQTSVGATATSSSVIGPSRPSPSILGVINVIDCDASLTGVIPSILVNFTPSASLKLDIVDSPGHTRRALVGDLKLVGSISIKLNAALKISGKCELTIPIPIVIAGPLALGVAPFVKIGIGAGLEGQIINSTGELSFTGELGAQVELGWECGGPTPTCQGLPGLTAINKLEPKFQVNDPRDGFRIELAGSLYVLAELEAVFILAVPVNLLAGKAGVVQSVDLGLEEDQAIIDNYASKYDLKAEAVIEPGSTIQKILSLTWAGSGASLSFQGKITIPISESPKGALTVSTSRVNLSGAMVDMRVDLNNTDYVGIDYNVVRVELWQKRATESEFKVIRAFDMTASNQTIFQYSWKPTTDDIGENEFAVFVYTKFPVPGLEIQDYSIKKVDVQCFSARNVGLTTTAPANTCADVWVGTAHTFTKDGIETEASVTWSRDPNIPEVDGNVSYIAKGSVKVKWIQLTSEGCSVEKSDFVIDETTGTNTLLVSYAESPVGFQVLGEVALHTNVTCPNRPKFFYPLNWVWVLGVGTIGEDGAIKGLVGGVDDYIEWSFGRPPP